MELKAVFKYGLIGSPRYLNPFNGIERTFPPLPAHLCINRESIQWNWKLPWPACQTVALVSESIQWNWKSWLNRLLPYDPSPLPNPFNGIESIYISTRVRGRVVARIHSMELKDQFYDWIINLNVMLFRNPFNGIESVALILLNPEPLVLGIHSMELKEHSVLRVLLDFIPFRVYLVSGI